MSVAHLATLKSKLLHFAPGRMTTSVLTSSAATPPIACLAHRTTAQKSPDPEDTGLDSSPQIKMAPSLEKLYLLL
jgi:hypothetical protein